MADGTGPYASSMVSFAIETEQVRPAIAQLTEVADRFGAVAREQITDGMVQGAGWCWAQQAVQRLRAELDEHETRVANGLASDVENLTLTVNRYVQTDNTSANSMNQLGTRTVAPSR